MIAAMLLLIAAQQPAPAAEATESEEIVVIGRRARGVRWDWRVNRAGQLAMCRITRSSGDPEIDQIGCEATRQCAASGVRGGRAMRSCIVPLRERLIVALAERRAAAR